MSYASFYDTLRESIKSKSIKVVSFDFFDTLMSRRVPRPTDAFQILAKALLDKKILAFPITPERFEQLRIQAEALARKEEPTVEVTIEEIYNRFPEGFFTCSTSEVIACELEVERNLLFPIAEMVELINFAASRGKRIIVISDIYFSPAQLKHLWGNSAPNVEIEFFTSSMLRTGKYSNLFPIIIKKLRIHPDTMLHTGDNYISDVKTPASFGVTTCFLPHGSNPFHKMLNAEYPRPAVESDLGLTTIRAKTTAHMSARSADQVNFFSYGAQILGPVLSTFVQWVNTSAIEAELKVVVPLLREGHIIGKLMNEIPGHPDVRLAYLSRRVLFQAGMVNVDREMLTSLRFGNLDSTVEDFLRLICLTSKDTPELKPLLTRSIQDDSIFNEVIIFLSGEKRLFSLIKQRALDIRRGVLKHFISQITVKETIPKEVGIVDIGWNGTIQRLLQEILDQEQLGIKLHGMYLMTTGTVNKLLMDGHLAKGYLIDGGMPNREFELLSRTLEIFEQSCAPSHGSVSHHDPVTGEPVLQPDRIPAEQRADIDDIQSGIGLAHRLFVTNLPKKVTSSDLAKIAHLVRPILLRAMLSPSPEEASLFIRWVHDDNLGSGAIMPILGTARLRQLLPYMTAQQFREIPMGELYWPAGAMALIDEKRCREHFAITQAALTEQLFDYPLNGSSEFAISTHELSKNPADPFEKKIPQVVYRNKDGKTYIRYTMNITEKCSFRWMPLSAPFTVKIDEIIFDFADSNGLRHYSVLEGKEISALTTSTGMEWISSSVWKGKGQNSAFYFNNLRSLGISDAGRLTVQILCEINEGGQMAERVALDYPRSLNTNSTVSLTPGNCVLDSFNGQAVQEKSTIVAKKSISLDGWMIGSENIPTEGEYFARFINLLGESRFVPMQAVTRSDVSEKHSNNLALTSGFSLVNCVLPQGDYALSIVRKGEDTCIVSRAAWRVKVEN